MRRERGSVTLLVVMVLLLLAALLGIMAVRGSSSDLRLAGSHRETISGLYCAESALNLARPCLATAVGKWNSMFSWTTGAAALDVSECATMGFTSYPLQGDIDGDGTNDFEVRLEDNIDENPSVPTTDSDLTAIIRAECTRVPHVVRQIVMFNGHGTEYQAQAGHGASHTGNQN